MMQRTLGMLFSRTIARTSALRPQIPRLASSTGRHRLAFFSTTRPSLLNEQSDDLDRLFERSSDSRSHSDAPPHLSVGAGGNDINRVEIIGGVMGDPVRRLSRKGHEYVSFRIITNRTIMRNGEEFDEAESHMVVVYGKDKLEHVMNTLKRGVRAVIIGHIHYETSLDGRVLIVQAENIMPFERYIAWGETEDRDIRGRRQQQQQRGEGGNF